MTINVNNPPKSQRGRCPRCAKMRLWVGENVAFNALSRKDNKTYVCSPCGTDEALVPFFGKGWTQAWKRWRTQA